MVAIDLTDGIKDLVKIAFTVSQLKANEFCFIKINTIKDTSSSTLNIIHYAVRQSRRVALSIPLDDTMDIDINVLFELLKVRSLCLRVKTNPVKFAGVYNYGTENSGDRDIFYAVRNKLMECPENKEIALEFEDEEDFRMVGSTIALLHEKGVKWVVLNHAPTLDDHSLHKFKELFNFLKMRACYKLNVYFDFLSPTRKNWQLQTYNTFSGISDVHIDISNRCTHSCVFCGLYSPLAHSNLKETPDENIVKEIKDFMKLEIDGNKALQIIESLPVDVERLQFGGIGDPLMHHQAIELIVAARERGFIVEVLSNMEYLTPDKIELLSKISALGSNGLNFIVNISGGTAETYIKTRPKQTEKNFQKVTENLKYFSKLKRENNNIGAWIILMCVVTKKNVDKLTELAHYAAEVQADMVWFKPMELHSGYMKSILPTEEDQPVLKEQLQESLEILDRNKIPVLMRDYYEQIIRQ